MNRTLHTTPNLELDAKSVVDLLNSNVDSFVDYAPMVDDCRNLLTQILRWKLNNCYRKANVYAD